MHPRTGEIAATLGLSEATTLIDLAVSCRKGLPVECLQELATTLGHNQKAFLYSLISESTLRRRQQRGKLSAEESDLVVRLASTWLGARDAFGDDEKAQRFLFVAHPLLGGRRPIELASANAVGAEAVEQLLGRLAYGSAA